MDRRFLRFRSWLTPAFASTLGVLVLGGAIARAQTFPPCAFGKVQTPCMVGGTIVLVSNPTGDLYGGGGGGGAGGAIINDPLAPGFNIVGNLIDGHGPGQFSRFGSFTVRTLSGLPAIVGGSASITCGVTGATTASLSVATGNGPPLILTCPNLATQGAVSTVGGSITFPPVSSLTVNTTVFAVAPTSADTLTVRGFSQQISLVAAYPYYFPHLAFGGGWQTTLTYVNYSPQSVSCQTSFLDDLGSALTVPFTDGAVSIRSDNLVPGASLHVQPQADPSAAGSGWARAQCTGPIKASLLYRLYGSDGAPLGEAGVNAMPAPSREFVTFGQIHTGVAWANPSQDTAAITIAALDGATGLSQGSYTFPLGANGHGANNIGPLLNLPSTFTGSIQITSTVPIVSLSLNAEAFPAFSALPPGDLPEGTPLAAGH